MTDKTITFPVNGMTCANCAMNIERIVKKLDGVSEAQVNFASEQAAVSFDPKALQLKDVVEKIHGVGFSVPAHRIEFAVTGMTCANCAANIERALNKKVTGVLDASVNFATERVSVNYIPGVSNIDDIVEAIEKAGYGAIPPDDGPDEEDTEQKARDA
jgi:Cu+-exporting ATPase